MIDPVLPLTPEDREFKNRRIDGWLENMLVTTKYAEAVIKTRDAFRKLPSEKRQAFIEDLDVALRRLIVRDANFMNVIRMGEELHEVDPQQRDSYGSLIAIRRNSPDRHTNKIVNPGGMLVRYRHAFNHPENYDMPEPDTTKIFNLFSDVKSLLSYAFSDLDFFNTNIPPKKAEAFDAEHEHQVTWTYGKMLGGMDDYVDMHSADHNKLYKLSYVSSQCHCYRIQNLNEETFENLIEKAINFRQIRLGALRGAIRFEKKSLNEFELPVFDEEITARIKKIRSLLAHEYDNPEHPENSFDYCITQGKPISHYIEDEVRKRNLKPSDKALDQIQHYEQDVARAFQDAMDLGTPRGKRKWVENPANPAPEVRVAMALNQKIQSLDLEWAGNERVFTFQPERRQAHPFIRALTTFSEKFGLEAAIARQGDIISFTVAAEKENDLVSAIERVLNRPRIDRKHKQPPVSR